MRKLWILGGAVLSILTLIVCDSASAPIAPCGGIVLASDCDPPPAAAPADSYPLPLVDRGGLFGNDSKTPPQAYLDAAAASGSQVPASGAIVVGIGMSNAELEIQAWQEVAQTDARIVEAACWGCTVNNWGATNDRGWDSAQKRLERLGIAPEDVDVVWVKMAHRTHEAATSAQYEAVIRRVVAEWPNVRQIWISDAIYRDYGDATRLSRRKTRYEPQAGWDAGRAVRQVVLAHVGETDPFVGWGPYLWANGAEARSDGLQWLREDFRDDGIHPSSSGAAKVADLLHAHFSNATGAEWYR